MDCEKDQTRQDMLQEIMEYRFALTELGLYLDTHPCDERAVAMHNEYSKQAKTLSDKYQKVYGPLTMDYPCNKWRWLEMPWPWEKGAY